MGGISGALPVVACYLQHPIGPWVQGPSEENSPSQPPKRRKQTKENGLDSLGLGSFARMLAEGRHAWQGMDGRGLVFHGRLWRRASVDLESEVVVTCQPP